MAKFLFLDDSQYRINQIKINFPFATICTTVEQTLKLLPTTRWNLVSLDHDLCGETYVDIHRKDCGMEVVRYLCKNSGKLYVDKIIVHSMNEKANFLMHKKLVEAKYDVHLLPFLIDNYIYLYVN